MKPRYSAKLIFQFRVVTTGISNKLRDIEERIIVCPGIDAESAYKFAVKHGKSEQYSRLNDAGGNVFFEFIGVADLIHLGIEAKPEEVWYAIRRAHTPSERRGHFIPNKRRLSAFAYERTMKGKRRKSPRRAE